MDAEISFSAAVWDMIWAAWNAARDDDYSYITGKENVKYNKLVLGDPEETSLFSNVSYNNTHNTSNSVFVDYAEGKPSPYVPEAEKDLPGN